MRLCLILMSITSVLATHSFQLRRRFISKNAYSFATLIMTCVSLLFSFFFSSRRRHTRSLCDWSSDVCSSDLLLKLSLRLIAGTIKGAITSPLAMLDATSRRPGVPWPAFFMLVFWSVIEATIFTFTLKPTASELLGELTGYDVNGFAFIMLLWLFLWVLVAGSFACIQVLNEAIKSKQYGQIISMTAIEIAVAMFEVLFLYRELVDAMTPWLAQQGVQLSAVATIGLAFFAWVGVRGLTWFLFGRFGAPALIALLSRQALV